jgi:hypothetical protein
MRVFQHCHSQSAGADEGSASLRLHTSGHGFSRAGSVRKEKRLQPLRFVLLLASLLAFAAAAAAGTLSGTVKNGTTGKFVPHQTVVLLSPMGGMQEITAVETDAQGHFQFNAPEIGQGPLLVRVPYKNVSYHQAAPPGRDSVDITVFESTAPASAMHITTRTIIFQPNGPRLLVGEEFLIENDTTPPVTYANPKGTFEFAIPEGAQLGQVNTTAPGGMPVTQGTIDKAKNRFALDFAIKPGESNIRISYDLPYDGDRASIRPPNVLAVARILLAAPIGVQMSSDGFSPAGSDQGFNLMTRENVAAGAALSVSLSGAAQVPAQSQGQPPDRGQTGRDAGSPAPAGENVQVLSPRLSSFQWIVLGGMGLFFLAGFFFLMRQPAVAGQQHAVPAPAGIPLGGMPAVVVPEKKSRARESAAPPSVAPPAASASAVAVLQEAERGARLNLEELKDTLFRLELRRQAGTISEQDYAHERGRLEAFIRDLVRG